MLSVAILGGEPSRRVGGNSLLFWWPVHTDSVRQDTDKAETMSVYKKVKNEWKQNLAGNPLEAIEQPRSS